MSFLDKSFKDAIKKQVGDVAQYRSTFTDEELAKVVPKFLEWREDHLHDEEIFTYEGSDFVIVRTPEKRKDKDGNVTSKPKQCKNAENPESHYWICAFKGPEEGTSRRLLCFLTKEQCVKAGWDDAVIMIGRITRQFCPINGEKKYFQDLEKLAKFLEVDELDRNDYYVNWKMSVDQVVR